MNADFTNILIMLVPSLIVAVTAFYFFNSYTRSENLRRDVELHLKHAQQTLPLRLQAYERMALFLERIALGNLLSRVKPNSGDKDSYEAQLISTIEQEFEHNLTQQIYLSQNCWNVIMTSKNTTIQMIRKANMSDKVENSQKMREHLLNTLLETTPPTDAAILFLKNEVGQLW
jgi:hypothetical protein